MLNASGLVVSMIKLFVLSFQIYKTYHWWIIQKGHICTIVRQLQLVSMSCESFFLKPIKTQVFCNCYSVMYPTEGHLQSENFTAWFHQRHCILMAATNILKSKRQAVRFGSGILLNVIGSIFMMIRCFTKQADRKKNITLVESMA